MKGIQGTEAMLLRVLSQKSLRPIEVHFQNTPDNEPLGGHTFTDSRKKFARVFRAHRTCSKLYGGHRGEFKQAQSGGEDAVAVLAENLTDCPRAEFRVELLHQCAGIEEEEHWLPASSFLDDSVAERARNILQALSYLFGGWRWFVSFGGFGLAMREVLVVEIVIVWFDDEGDAFLVVNRHAFDRTEDTVFVNRFNTDRHRLSLTVFLQEAY